MVVAAVVTGVVGSIEANSVVVEERDDNSGRSLVRAAAAASHGSTVKNPVTQQQQQQLVSAINPTSVHTGTLMDHNRMLFF